MNKFITNLTASSDNIKSARAALISENAEASQRKLIETLKEIKRKLEGQKLALSDLYPDSELSLLVTKTSFDADKWARDLQNIKVSLLNNQVELKSAQETFDEWFTEDISK